MDKITSFNLENLLNILNKWDYDKIEKRVDKNLDYFLSNEFIQDFKHKIEQDNWLLTKKYTREHIRNIFVIIIKSIEKKIKFEKTKQNTELYECFKQQSEEIEKKKELFKENQELNYSYKILKSKYIELQKTLENLQEDLKDFDLYKEFSNNFFDIIKLYNKLWLIKSKNPIDEIKKTWQIYKKLIPLVKLLIDNWILLPVENGWYKLNPNSKIQFKLFQKTTISLWDLDLAWEWQLSSTVIKADKHDIVPYKLKPIENTSSREKKDKEIEELQKWLTKKGKEIEELQKQLTKKDEEIEELKEKLNKKKRKKWKQDNDTTKNNISLHIIEKAKKAYKENS